MTRIMAVFSIIQKSQLEGAKRLDAEYYQPEYLDLEKKLDSIETKTIDELSKSVVSFGAYSLTSYLEWQDSGVPYVNVGDIHEGYIDTSNIKHISEKVDDILRKSRVNNVQVLLTMAGTIGNAAVAHNLPRSMNANQAIAKITPIDDISPYYLVAFLNSKYGQLQTQREIVSSVQANIFLGPIKKFRVPLFDKASASAIENKYRDFLKTLEHSQSLYAQAENLLLEQLGLKDFKADEDLYSIVNFSEIKLASRMDAEYFQPKYEKLLEILKQSKPLIGLVKQAKRRAEIIPKKEYSYIEISDVNAGSGEVTSNSVLGKELPTNAKIKIEGGELLVSKVRPTRGAVTIIPMEWKKDYIVSGAFSVFDVQYPIGEYLQVVLRSVIVKLQIERPTTGTSYPTITDADVENILIPVLSLEKQNKIGELVQKSHVARKKAKELLEETKRKVEEEIEKSVK